MLQFPVLNCFLSVLLLALAALAESKPSLIKGISYGPVPLKSREGGAELAQDDWMEEAAKPMWGPRGRNDLHVMKQLGANMVRLYGNNPNVSHAGFLDEAHAQGLKVTPGMSDYPYYQMPEGNCQKTNYDCFSQIKALYTLNLQGGFMTASSEYHPALAYFNIINEPDLKMPSTATTGSTEGPKLMAKAIISAFDAVLEAEKEAGVAGNLINFTASFSYAVCIACADHANRPALGQMATLADAMHNPESYGYTPLNKNLGEAYRTRWTHSFNTANPARDLQPQFFSVYDVAFDTTPVFIAEYHKPGTSLLDDVQEVLDLATGSELFLGISFFQYQVAYWKGGTEEDFGLFGLGNYSIAELPYYGKTYNVWCLVPASNSDSPQSSLPKDLAQVFGGPYLDPAYLCLPSPESVSISAEGFQAIASQGSGTRLAAFVQRVVRHMGAVVNDEAALEDFAVDYLGGSGKTYEDMVVAISHQPSWTTFSNAAACVADRTAGAGQIGAAIEWLCGHAENFSCEGVPASCSGDAFSTGDWLFSRYYKTVGSEPLQNCYFGGAAIYASPDIFDEQLPSCAAGARRALRGYMP